MVCQAVLVEITNKKGKKKLVSFLQTPGSEDVKTYLRDHGKTSNDLIPCGGKIIATIRAVDDPYFGGCSSAMDIEYQCEKCKCLAPSGYNPADKLYGTFLPHTEEALSKFVTEAIEKL